MIAKKNARADLEKKRGVLFQIGLLTAGSFTLAAFTYTTPLDRDARDTFVTEHEIAYEMVTKEKQEEKVVEQPQNNQQQNQQNQQQNATNSNQEISSSVSETKNTNTKVVSTVTPPGGNGIITGGTVTIDDDPLIKIPDVEASFPGGYVEMMKFIQDNYKVPEDAMEMGEQGKVYVSFIVEKDGTISHIGIDKKVFPSIDREAKRVVGLFPKWNPGEVNHAPVKTLVNLPIVVTYKN